MFLTYRSVSTSFLFSRPPLRSPSRNALTANPNLIIVKSLGNDFASTIFGFKQHGLIDILTDLRDEGFDDRIIFVAATGRQNNLDARSNILPGGTDIAAPGDSVISLAPSTGRAPIGGTSAAAALITGSAAQLLAFDSSLPGNLVKSFIQRGAMASRYDTLNNSFQPAMRITDAPEPVFQLDAYSSLKLVSAERPGTPVCGYPVEAKLDSLIFHKPEPGKRMAVKLPDTTSRRFGPSVAQGGRQIAATTRASGVLIMDQTGKVTGSVAGILQRQYLEEGFADVLTIARRRLTHVIRLTDKFGKQRMPVDLLSNVDIDPAGGEFTRFHELDARVSPLGQEVVFDLAFGVEGCDRPRIRMLIFRADTRGQNVRLIREFGCGFNFRSSTAAWNDRGDSVYVFSADELNSSTLVTVSGPTGARFGQMSDIVSSPNLIESGQVLLARMVTRTTGPPVPSPLSDCREVRRGVQNLSVDVAPPIALPLESCFPVRGLNQANAPARIAVERR